MKILLITPSASMGGTERYMLNFAKVFAPNNTIHMAFYKDRDKEVIGWFRDAGCKIKVLPYYVKHPLSFLISIKKLYEKENYDIVYIHANHLTHIIYTYPVWLNGKTKIMYHSHNTNGDHKILLAMGRKLLNKVCYKQFACSVDASMYMYGHKNAYVINNSVDIDSYRYNKAIRDEIRNGLGINDEIVIGHIGRFSRQKNHVFLLRIFKEYTNIHRDAKLVLIGDGEDRDTVVKTIDDLNIKDNVILVGNTNRANDYYQCFDLFLLPSLYEGLPFVGIEAQASGTPCLLSDTIPEKIKITPLVYFQSLDSKPSEWASSIETIIKSNPQKKDYSQLIEQAGYGLRHMKEEYHKAGVDL